MKKIDVENIKALISLDAFCAFYADSDQLVIDYESLTKKLDELADDKCEECEIEEIKNEYENFRKNRFEEACDYCDNGTIEEDCNCNGQGGCIYCGDSGKVIVVCPSCHGSGTKLDPILEKIKEAQHLFMNDGDGSFLKAMNILTEITGLKFGLQYEGGEELTIRELHEREKQRKEELGK